MLVAVLRVSPRDKKKSLRGSTSGSRTDRGRAVDCGSPGLALVRLAAVLFTDTAHRSSFSTVFVHREDRGAEYEKFREKSNKVLKFGLYYAILRFFMLS